MSIRLPRAASTAAPATLPPAGLPGLDPASSRLVTAAERGPAGRRRTWHVLDNAAVLQGLGVAPAGTILCVHGNPTWSYLWRDLVTAATDAAASGGRAWRVVAVDQLDMGYSERTGVLRPLARRVTDLGDLTDALGLEGPVITLGHDWGGPVSLGWAVDHPALLAAVMLLNTAVHHPRDAAVPAPLRAVLRPPALGAATVSTPAFLEATLALAHPPLSRAVKDAYRSPYLRPDRRGGIGGFVVDIPVGSGHPSDRELDRIARGAASLEVPGLILWGPRDPVFGEQHLEDLSERMPQAGIHRFEGAGHLLAEDVDYAPAVLDWLGDRESQAPVSPDVGTTGPTRGEWRPLWRALDERRDGDDAALIEMVRGAGPRVISWRLLSRRVRDLAAGLHDAGVRRGDRVSLLVPPGADLTAVLYACLRIGAVAVVADAGLGIRGLTRAVRGARPDHLVGAVPGLLAARALGWPGRRISTARLAPGPARALGVTHALADLIERGRTLPAPPEPGPDDIAAVLFTSGSTGPAKGAVYRHRQLGAVRDALSAQYGIGGGTGLVAGFAPFALLGPALGARSVTPDMDVTSPKTLTAASVAQAAAAADATVVFLSPAALANVVATAGSLTAVDRAALARVRTVLSAGAPVREPLLAAASQLMPDAVPHTPYGMTEGLLLTDITLSGIREASTDAAGGACVGLPIPGTRVLVDPVDDAGVPVGRPTADPGVTGEIVVSSSLVFDHYDRLQLTDLAARRDTPRGERWHRTGDVGHIDASGRLWVEGRLPHLITTSAGVLTPVGLEREIETVAGVARAAIVGVGPAGVQQVVAVVETEPPSQRPRLAAPDLARRVRSSLTRPPAAVIVVPRLPTDIRHNSKIDRTRLAGWAAGVLAGGRMVRP